MNILLYGFWLFAYGLCGILGLIEPVTDLQAAMMTALSVLFFVPPVILLIRSLKRKEQLPVKVIRWICIGSLGLTLAGFIANIAAVNASEQTGLVLYRLLNFVSVPMVCSRHYVLSLFLWACLLCATFPKIYKKGN